MSSTLVRVAGWVAIAALVGCRSNSPSQPADAPPSDSPATTDARIDAAPPIDGPAIDAPVVTGERIRIVAGNLTSGDNQAYQDPGIRILRGLHADIALIQEFNFAGNTPAELQTFVDSAFGSGYTFVRGEATQDIPNGIVTRFPIRASGEWQDSEAPNREYLWAQIDIPGDIDLYAISVHLLSTGGADRRDIEARELVQNIEALPANTYVVLGGDFNTGARTEPCVQTLSSVLVTTGPFPADQAGVSETNASRRSPYDWVLANAELDAREIPVVIGTNQFATGLVVDTRVYTPISDLAPAQASDSGASMMQHMAVVRDFAVADTQQPPPPAGVFINEILADEPGSNTAAEFVELVNGSAGDVDLAGCTLADAVSTRHVFAPGTVLAAGRAVVVYGNDTGIPVPRPGNAVGASTGTLGLNNTGDTVTLACAGATLDSVVYPAALVIESISINRRPDGSAGGTFVRHDMLTTLTSSPGKKASGEAF